MPPFFLHLHSERGFTSSTIYGLLKCDRICDMHTVVQIFIFVFIDHIDDPDRIHVLQQDISIEEREAIKIMTPCHAGVIQFVGAGSLSSFSAMRLIFSFYNKFRQHVHNVTVKRVQIVMCQQEPFLFIVILTFQNMTYGEKKKRPGCYPRSLFCPIRRCRPSGSTAGTPCQGSS